MGGFFLNKDFAFQFTCTFKPLKNTNRNGKYLLSE